MWYMFWMLFRNHSPPCKYATEISKDISNKKCKESMIIEEYFEEIVA